MFFYKGVEELFDSLADLVKEFRSNNFVCMRTDNAHLYGQVFVIGLPRSGTSLLYKTMVSHPDISLFYESDIFYSWPSWLGGIQSKQWGRKLDLWNGHLSRHGFADSLDDFPACNKREAMTYLWELQYQAKREGSQPMIVGEKSAMYGAHLKKLSDAFPEAKFVILHRDLVEVFDSVKRAANGGDSYFSTKGLFYEYLGDMARMLAGVNKLKQMGRSVIEIDFTELVTNRRQVSQSLCEFLNIDYSELMITGEGFDETVIPVGTHHMGVKKGEIQSEGRGEQVSVGWIARVNRYQRMWLGETEGIPKIPERMECWIMYKLSKLRLGLKTGVYWLIPERFITSYRARKNKK